MIGHIRGTVTARDALRLVVDVQGVGYLLHAPNAANVALGDEVLLHTHLAVRENALDLYGFLTTDELGMFELLITLPKIGPKSAMQIMTHADVALLKKAAVSGDASYLSKISGIGKKSAEKIVLGLREKFGAEDVAYDSGEAHDHDVIDALIALGYSQREARGVLEKLPADIEGASERIRAALKILGERR